MRVTWHGGPLDGCVDEQEHPTALWLGPDPVEPKAKAIAYVLKGTRYEFSQELSERANSLIGNRWN